MENKLTISLAPHTAGEFTVRRMMYDVIIALLPALAASVYFFGLGALRVVVVGVGSAVFFEYFIQKFMLKIKPTVSDGSAAVTGLLLAFNLPSSLPWWMVVIGSLVAIGIAKMAFGGIGNNPFNPALVARVFLLMSFPVSMTNWPKPIVTRMALVDAVTTATPLAVIKEGLKSGEPLSQLMMQVPDYWNLFIGNRSGCIGETSALALLIGFIYLLYRKVITWHIPVVILATAGLFTTILWKVNPSQYAHPLFHLLTGGILLGAIYMATDLVTSPMVPLGMMIYGVGIGILAIVIRVFGVYPEGMSFAILVMNAFVPLIDKFCKPKRFGEAK